MDENGGGVYWYGCVEVWVGTLTTVYKGKCLHLPNDLTCSLHFFAFLSFLCVSCISSFDVVFLPVSWQISNKNSSQNVANIEVGTIF